MSDTKKEYRLPREFTEKWLKALRSGEYEQGTGTLCEIDEDNNKKYCCLGVAGVLFYSEKYLKTINFYNAGVLTKGNQFSDIKVSLQKIPYELRENLKFQQNLAKINDENVNSFKDVINWIEENVELYDKV